MSYDTRGGVKLLLLKTIIVIHLTISSYPFQGLNHDTMDLFTTCFYWVSHLSKHDGPPSMNLIYLPFEYSPPMLCYYTTNSIGWWFRSITPFGQYVKRGFIIKTCRCIILSFQDEMNPFLMFTQQINQNGNHWQYIDRIVTKPVQ